MEGSLKGLQKKLLRFVRGERETTNPEPGELPVFMHPIEYSQLLAVVESLAPRRVLEWGSGGSTRALLERCDFIETFVSVEHNAMWHARVAEVVTDPRLKLFLHEPTVAEPNPPRKDKDRSRIISEWMLLCERDPSVMADYVAAPATLGMEFDFVLVDGRARTHCLIEGFRLLRPGGVILIHDAQRPEYHATVNSLGRAIFLEPWEQGQICFVRKPEADA